jgi:hypothetical protein
MKKVFYILASVMLVSVVASRASHGGKESAVGTAVTVSAGTLSSRDAVFLRKRDFIYSDEAIKVKPRFVPLPAGAIAPRGWLKDWAEAAANGITGHLDERSPVYGMGWKGVGFKALGADETNGTGWPLEQCSYWLDGAVKLAYELNDKYLLDKVQERLNLIVNGVLESDSHSFVWWVKDLFTGKENYNFNNWAHSHIGRALTAYYEASGDPRVLEAITKVYSRFTPQAVPFTFGDGVSGCTNIDPMLLTYELSGNKDVLNTILKTAADEHTQEAVKNWHDNKYDTRAHGVITYENLRIPALMYLVTGEKVMYDCSLAYINWLDATHLLPFDVASAEEHLAGIGCTRNTETCDVPCAALAYRRMLEISGEGSWGDRVERVIFNAGPAPVSRDFQTMSYYQAPNRIEGLMPSETPGHPGRGSYNFEKTGHHVLCCVGNLNRVIPDYIQNQWMGTADKGVAATLYAPSLLQTVVGEGVPVEIETASNYPFEETLKMTVSLETATEFPVYLRIPAWCLKPKVAVNGKTQKLVITDGFMKVLRQWKSGDVIALSFPMHVTVTDGVETPYPESDYFIKGGSAGRKLAPVKDVNSPYRTVSYGPLLFALPVNDLDPNHQAPDAKWQYALVSNRAKDYRIEHVKMPAYWSWQIAEAPVRLKTKAVAFDWQPSPVLPLPKEYVTGGVREEITLIPYGCTKFRISMFPIAK